MSNMSFSKNLIENLMRQGVREFVVCAGSRNAPFVKLINEYKHISIYSFFEERSASFYALGRIKQTQKPVAVIITSGTAVAETMPAVIEAYYSLCPLIIISGDRPKSYRGSGAPQAIEQKKILFTYCEATYDLSAKEDSSLCKISQRFPTHINVCFDEPLIDEENISLSSRNIKSSTNTKEIESKLITKKEDFSKISDLINNLKDPLVIVGGLSSDLIFQVQKMLESWDLPIYFEATSGLREWHTDKKIKSGDLFIKKIRDKNLFSSVIRIGDIPSLKFWRDLEEINLKTISFSEKPFSGLSFVKEKPFSLKSHLEALSQISIQNKNCKIIFEEDKIYYDKIMKLMTFYKNSESCFIYELSKYIKESLFIGNSLPIREWNLFANFDNSCRQVVANRGANGVDGLISTYLATECQFGIFGDLSTLYDLAALGLSNYAKNQAKQIIVVNNFSGQIFSRIYEQEYFQNPHKLKFKNWAKMFSWNYICCDQVSSLKDIEWDEPSNRVIEVLPDNRESQIFWKCIQEF